MLISLVFIEQCTYEFITKKMGHHGNSWIW